MGNTIMKREPHNYYGFVGVIAAIALYAFIVSIDGTGIYKYIAILPITYAILSLVFIKVYQHVTIPVCIVLVFMFLRYVVTPLTLFVEGYPTDAYNIFVDNYFSLYSVILMVYEMLFIFLGLTTKVDYTSNGLSDEGFVERFQTNGNFRRCNFFLKVIILATVAIYVMYPSLISSYTFIFGGDLGSINTIFYEQTGSLPRGMRFVGFTLGEICRFVILERVIQICFNKYQKTRRLKYWILSLLAIGINAMIVNSRVMMGLLLTAVFVVQIYRLYPKFRKQLYTICISVGVLLIVAIVMHYWKESLTRHSFSIMLQNYTNGFYDVYQSLYAYNIADLSILEKLEMFFLGDGFSKIVIISSFVSPTLNSSNIYNYYLYGHGTNGGIVVPLVSQMAYYFTPLIGPLVTYFYMRIMRKFEQRYYSGKENMSLNLYLAMTFAVAPFMFNNSIVIHCVTTTVLPLIVASKINRYKT